MRRLTRNSDFQLAIVQYSDRSKTNKSKASVLSHEEQLAIVQYSDEHGVKAAADHFAVSQHPCLRLAVGPGGRD